MGLINAITLPRLMWTGLRDNVDPAIAAISVVLIAVIVAIIGLKTFYQLSRHLFAGTAKE